MLTPGQSKYLEPLSNGQKMVVKPFNPKGLEIADKIVNDIRNAVPELEVLLLGSLPLRILGQEDIDISIFCIKSEQHKYLDNLISLLGDITKQSEHSIRWDFGKDGFSVSIWLTDPTRESTKNQVKLFNLLMSKPELREEYIKIKEETKNLSYKEYQRAKYEFYNKTLGLKESL